MKSFFQINFWIIVQKPKNILKNREVWILIKVQYVIATSMDMSRHALETNGKLFQISESFFELAN